MPSRLITVKEFAAMTSVAESTASSPCPKWDRWKLPWNWAIYLYLDDHPDAPQHYR